MKNTNYKIICEEIESNNIILEDVITEGLIDNLKNMGKSALNGIANAANSMAEKFITGIASIFGKPKQNGSINKINSDVLAQKLSDNNIIKKLFGDKINEIINGCKSISKDELMSVMDDKKVESELEKLPDKNEKQEPVAESVFHNLDNLIWVSRLTMLSEYFFTALLMGNSKYSPVSESGPPKTTNSGLKILIRPAMPLPKFTPISSKISIVNISSL